MKYISLLFVIGYIGAAEAHPEILACKKINKEFKNISCDIMKGGELTLRIDVRKPKSSVSSDERLFIENLHRQFIMNNVGQNRFVYMETSLESGGAIMVCNKRSYKAPEACIAQKAHDFDELRQFSIFKVNR